MVSHELGANYTQNCKERQRERKWFGNLQSIVNRRNVPSGQSCLIGASAAALAQGKVIARRKAEL